jgi:hypothetical protein
MHDNRGKLRIHNMISKGALCYGSECWIINNSGAQKQEYDFRGNYYAYEDWTVNDIIKSKELVKPP